MIILFCNFYIYIYILMGNSKNMKKKPQEFEFSNSDESFHHIKSYLD